MRVDVAELNVRAAPSTAAAVLGRPVRRGDVLIVQDAPVEADGYRWYFGHRVSGGGELPTLPEPLPFPGDDPPQGWFATPAEATTYLVRLEYRCMAAPDLASVAAMLDSELLPCFGSRLLTFEGSLSCIDCGGVGPVWEPSWLAHSFRDPVVRVGNEHLQLYFPPGVPGSDSVGSLVRVTGRFGDSRSSSCQISLESDQGPTIRLPDAVAIEYCRRHFVVESLTILGPDPSYAGI